MTDRGSSDPGRFKLARSISVVALVALLALVVASPSAAEDLVGRPLSEVLRELSADGLKLVFTTSVVRPEMRVVTEPRATEPRDLLEELLAPHELTFQDGPNDVLVIVPVRRSTPARLDGLVVSRADQAPVADARVLVIETGREVLTAADGRFSIEVPIEAPFTLEARRSGFVLGQVEGSAIDPDSSEVVIVLDPAPVMEEELLVTPSRVSILRGETVAAFDLSRDDIHALPHLGDDFFRALSLLPGITANDVSARFHIRGGRRDETQVLLDGQELYEVYHLQDYDSALSVISPTTLENVDVLTGGFTAEHGDRMSGILDMTTVTPRSRIEGSVGIGLLSVDAGAAGLFDDSRGDWLLQARRGSIDLASQLLGNEDPRYWDAFAKLGYQLNERNTLRGNLLHADDELSITEVVEDETKRVETDYASSYLWLTEQAILTSDLFVEHALSASRIERDRLGIEREEDVRFVVRDLRELDVLSLRQNWSWQPSDRHFLKMGFELRRFETEFDYVGENLFANPLAEIRERGIADELRFQQRFEEDHYSAHIADRIRLSKPLTLELGLRYDEHTQTDESLLSPRLNLAYSIDDKSIVRLAWGRFTQSQRPYELQVEDGETSFFRVERSEHRVVGFERVFDQAPGHLVLRAEIYRREVSNPRPRFENLFEPINTFPEIEPDRVRIAPQRSVAEGLEIFLKGSFSKKTYWWANYTYSTTDDIIDAREQPRGFDQPHALNLDLDHRIGSHWRFNFAWRFHSGWPTTSLTFSETIDEDGEPVLTPELGPIYGERLPDYHRLDLRVSREWRLRRGRLSVYVDLQNVYDRGNVAGFDFQLDEATGRVVGTPEEWAGFLPSGGVRWDF